MSDEPRQGPEGEPNPYEMPQFPPYVPSETADQPPQFPPAANPPVPPVTQQPPLTPGAGQPATPPMPPTPPGPPAPPMPPFGAWPPPPSAAQPPTKTTHTSRTLVALAVLVALLSSGIGVAIGASLAHSTPKTATASALAPSDSSNGTSSDSGSSSALPGLPSPSTNSSSNGASASDIEKNVDKSIVDINVTFTEGSGAGTGIVLTSSGLVLTNNHVIANATKVEVQSVTTGDTWTAKVLGYDITDDVALIQLQNASGLTPVSVGDSDNVKSGDQVIALGNALGQGGSPSVSQGAVADVNQSIDVQNEDGSTSNLSGLIETSARLEPGDSGGPLVDASSGLVIGMDAAATTSQHGRTTNDSYAIPINTALNVARQIETGHESDKIHVGERALLGVQVQGDQPVVAAVQQGSPGRQGRHLRRLHHHFGRRQLDQLFVRRGERTRLAQARRQRERQLDRCQRSRPHRFGATRRRSSCLNPSTLKPPDLRYVRSAVERA